ncbi:MAG TPA: DNA translocase FtsK 4TM domain-containing protein [Blastocatellia bacterium]|nr:DNA translocase FtsK 4TM domain-containing protein [Blastocatellia bacterium]
MSGRPRAKPSSTKSLANEVLAVVLVAASVLLLLSLLSYDPRDPSWNSVGPQLEPRNMIGAFGSHVSDFFLNWFGLASLIIPILLTVIAARAFFSGSIPVRKVVGATLLLGAFSGFLSLFPQIKIGLLTRTYNGGAVGHLIEAALAGSMSAVGAAIMLTVASVLTLVLTMEISLASMARWVRRARQARADARQGRPTVFGRIKTFLAVRVEQYRVRAEQRRTQKAEERRLKEAEEAERKREERLQLERERRELEETRKRKLEEARELEAQQPFITKSARPLSASASSLSSVAVVETASATAATRTAADSAIPREAAVAETAPSLSPLRRQMREAISAHAARTETIRTGHSSTDPTMDPDVAEMISTASIVRTLPGEAPTNTGSQKPVQRRTAVETLSGATYKLPAIDLLETPISHLEQAEEELRERATILAEKCKEFSVTGHIHRINPGPVVTTFEFKPDPGIKYSRVVGLAEDLCLALKAESIRIDRIPGKSTVGIEAPNSNREKIFLRDVIESPKFQKAESKLTIALGKTINGEEYIADLAKMPHLLIAGATGAGKSVTLNAIICSILYKASPEDVKFIMVDPKRVELGLYEGIPHLLTPIVTDPKRAANALKWAVNEMEVRYRLLAQLGVRNIEQYNRQVREMIHPTLFDEHPESPKPLPYIAIAIDELADLMMVARSEVETSIARLAQMARAVGIHLVLATQRPSVDIITGVIKANIPSRIAFRVSSKVDSRTIIDSNGAEALLGQGDMLFLPPGSARLIRVHGSFANETEIKQISDHIRKQAEPEYNEQVTLSDQETMEGDGFEAEQDDLYDEALAIVTDMGRASTSVLQRRLSIGYGRAAKILDMMERQGFIGPAEGSKPRKVLQAAHEFRERLAQRIEEPFD